MFLFTSSLDQAADKLVSAHAKVARAEGQGHGVETARRELALAEAAWQAVCDGVRSHARANARSRWMSASKRGLREQKLP